MSLIGKAICLFRERVGLRPVHDMRRVVVPDTHEAVKALSAFGTVPARQCRRCGFTVLVKPRKRKGAE